MKIYKSSRGFTLLEVAFSVAILALVLLSSFRILVEAHQMTQEARYRMLATSSARSILEAVKDTPLSQVGNIGTAAFLPTELPGAAGTIITNPANLTGVQIATVTVRITWTNPKGLPGILEVTTMRSRF